MDVAMRRHCVLNICYYFALIRWCCEREFTGVHTSVCREPPSHLATYCDWRVRSDFAPSVLAAAYFFTPWYLIRATHNTSSSKTRAQWIKVLCDKLAVWRKCNFSHRHLIIRYITYHIRHYINLNVSPMFRNLIYYDIIFMSCIKNVSYHR